MSSDNTAKKKPIMHCRRCQHAAKKTKDTKEETKKEDTKEDDPPSSPPWDQCEGAFPDSCYPTPPSLEEQEPDDLPRQENQEPPAEDEWHCPVCKNSPCLFLQYQDEVERQVDIMYPEVTNKQKRYHMYRHMSRRLHGHLGKGKRKPLPECFTRGLRELFPSEDYVGFKPSPFESGPRGDRDRFLDDGTTYD
jgi:DNA-directed RNA polymerase subunit M/transcription elongation factor TFIIS